MLKEFKQKCKRNLENTVISSLKPKMKMYVLIYYGLNMLLKKANLKGRAALCWPWTKERDKDRKPGSGATLRQQLSPNREDAT